MAAAGTTNVNTKHMCGTCGKSFRRKIYYEQHIVVCEEIHKLHTQNKDEELLDLPDYGTLYRLVRVLTQKYETLEKEMQTMKAYVKKVQKKINILDWLQQNHTTGVTEYAAWKESIAINEAQLNYMFQHSYIEGMTLILQQNIPLNATQSFPIRCFEQKNQTFFYFNDGNWNHMDDQVIEELIRHINFLLMKKFQEWKQEHQKQIDEDDTFHERYVEYMRTILGGIKPREESNRIIKKKTYHYMKNDLKNIVTYEFVF